MSRETEISKILLDIKAVQISPDRPFLWASGLRSPIYCDNRLLISHVIHRQRICLAFKSLVAEQGWAPDVIAGTATAGIPHAAWLAQAMDLPMVYVRGKAKTHGRENRIEGTFPSGARVVLIEDLVSTGGSALAAADALIDRGAKIAAISAIFQYGMEKAAARFQDAGIPLFSLTSLDSLMEMLQEQGLLKTHELATLKDWQTDPHAWSERYSLKQ